MGPFGYCKEKVRTTQPFQHGKAKRIVSKELLSIFLEIREPLMFFTVLSTELMAKNGEKVYFLNSKLCTNLS